MNTLTRFCNELARQSVVALDAALKARPVRDVVATLDTQLLSGSGDGIATPKGMFAWTGTPTPLVDGALTLDHPHDAEGFRLAANVAPSRVHWFVTSREFVTLRKVKGHLRPLPDLARPHRGRRVPPARARRHRHQPGAR